MTKMTTTNGNKLNTSLSIEGDLASAITLHIRSKASILHIGSLDSSDTSPLGLTFRLAPQS